MRAGLVIVGWDEDEGLTVEKIFVGYLRLNGDSRL